MAKTAKPSAKKPTAMSLHIGLNSVSPAHYETWCLFDGELIDDELYVELGRFAAGVRVLVLSDSCHSGTVTRARVPSVTGAGRSKMMPSAVALRTYREHRAFYDTLQKDIAKSAGKVEEPNSVVAPVAASARLSALTNAFKPAVILISGCQDNQTSMDGDHNGAFTEQLLQVWNNGAFRGNYARFHSSIKSRLPASQTPNFYALESAASFVGQEPFTV